MKTQQILSKLKELGTIEAVTGGRNGYPTPEVGLAFIPNDEESLEKAQLLIPDSELYQFHSRDGWGLVELSGAIYGGLENYNVAVVDFGDNYTIIEVGNEKDIKDVALGHLGYESWGYDSWKKMKEEEDMDEDEIEAIKKSTEELKNNLEVGINVINCGVWEQTLSNLGYSHDTHNYSVGLFIDNETEEGWEIWDEEYK